MKKIYCLYDYKNQFGSKHNAIPYRSGMDKNKLEFFFAKHNYQTIFLGMSDVNFLKNEIKNSPVLYTSQEDYGYLYKDYIEDVICGLEIAGAKIIPNYKYLRANNNKVFMEILRNQIELEGINNIRSFHFGTIEEAMIKADDFEYPVVVKGAKGAMSRNVVLAKNKNSLRKALKDISKTPNLKAEIKDQIRIYKHKGYLKESKYRNKFIIQNFISGLKNDWKILVYHDKYYVLKRYTRKNDFRASGMGKLEYTRNIDEKLLFFAESIKKILNTPFVSLDIAMIEKKMYLIEFQLVNFGTYTISYSDFYFKKNANKWQIHTEKSELEEVYAESIVNYLKVN